MKRVPIAAYFLLYTSYWNTEIYQSMFYNDIISPEKNYKA